MHKISAAILVALMLVAACRSSKTSKKELSEEEKARIADSIAMVQMMEGVEYDAVDTTAAWDGYSDESYDYDYTGEAQGLETYTAAKTRAIDITHTKLEVKFDYEKQQLLGKAYITLKPYFYATDVVELDAKGFDVLGVFMVGKNNANTALQYTYEDQMKLNVKLGREYKANEEITLFINYVAKPEESGESVQIGNAIKENKGLYFINPTGEDKNKPRQIWTQGETEAASRWFPTFDSPNERFSQEIIMTVDTGDVTLSNGKLLSSKVNRDGTRTDHWKQTLPHAPYLAMMAVGKFAIVKDKWRTMEVNYYVEKEYAKYAKLIFGNTPKMIEFYSKKLGVDYPWDKYSQIVVRDFVSGAMENTGAVIHFDRLQHDDRTHIDEPLEEIIAHELFHHWFGDLVTCESWANLPLNESFATYGEYLWIEHAYGREEADKHIDDDLSRYLQENEEKTEDLVRFKNTNPDDMFDAHSYQKGGRVLHMLRKYVGDDAFFKSLNLYLTNNKFKSVEMHNLRLAFEEVTGEDLNWFFNQWFYSAGHPVLSVEHSYNEDNGTYTISVTQTQGNAEKNIPAVYRIPLNVDIYEGATKRTEKIEINQTSQTFEFATTGKPRWVNFDAEKMLLCQKTENKEMEQWKLQLEEGPLFIDRQEALDNLSNIYDEEQKTSMIRTALNDRFWAIRLKGLRSMSDYEMMDKGEMKRKVQQIAESDKKSAVRSRAMNMLGDLKDDAYTETFRKGLNDSSYQVMGEALNSLAKVDSVSASAFAEKSLATEKNKDMKALYLYILGSYGAGDYMAQYEEAFKNPSDEGIYLLTSGLGSYMMNGDEDRVLKGQELLSGVDVSSNWVLMFIMYGVNGGLKEKYMPVYEELDAKFHNGTITSAEKARMEKIRTILENAGGFEEEEGEDEGDGHGHHHHDGHEH